MASAKRHLPGEGVYDAKKARSEIYVPIPSAKPEFYQRVALNPADCDLDFTIEGNGLFGSALHEEGFAYCWSGARANVGITGGKYCFGCKVVSAQPVDMEDTAPDQQHVCRLGISRGDDIVGNLGESKNSFGYGGTGKFSNAGKFSDYGEKFGIGDTIVCCIDLESKPVASIGFSKNGKWLGTAMQFDAGPFVLAVVDSRKKELPWESALFPHVLLKNVVVQMQFSVEDGLVPEVGYKPWASASGEKNMIIGPTFSDPRYCEVIMMVGLPASGKTTWAEKWMKDQPEKRYILLGTNLVLDQMKVPGLMRKHNYGERFDRLMDRATGIFNVLMSRAAKIPRNYIIDQTNVFKSARKRKLKPFADFWKIAIVVFPKPEELRLRADKRFKEMGKEVPPDAVNNMLENYVLPMSKDMPGTDEFFDKVIFVELNREESQKCLDQMKKELALSNNKSLALPYGGSPQSFAGFPLQNQGSFTGSGSYCRDSNPSNSPCTHKMASQFNAASQTAELQGSMRLNSFPGVYPNSHNLPRPRAASPYGPYSNYEISPPLRDNTVYGGTFGAIPTDTIKTFSNSGVHSPYGWPNTEGNMGFPSAFPDPYRSGMNEPSLVANARTMAFNYNTHGGPYGGIGGPRPDLLASRTTPSVFCPSAPATHGSLSSYGTPYSRPPHGNFPGDMQYSGGYETHHPRY